MQSKIACEFPPSHREARWVWHYGIRRKYLTHTLDALERLSIKKYESDETFKYAMQLLDVKLSEFNFTKGPVQPAVQKWFKPDRSLRFHSNVNVKARKNSFFSAHKKVKSSSLSDKQKDEKLGRALSLELNNFTFTSRPGRGTEEFNAFKLGSEARKAIKHLPGEITTFTETGNYRASHRVVQLYSKKPALDLRPNFFELQYLIAIMRDTLVPPHTITKCHDDNFFAKVHHTAPVLMLVVYPGAKARIICGYNAYDSLHIQYSELRQFTEDSFFTEMKELLAWTKPRCQWDTTQPPQMMIFDESEEDEVLSEQSEANSSDDSTDSETDSVGIPTQPMNPESDD